MSGRNADQKPGDIRSVKAADGARLEYEVVGDGPPLVMLHGLLASRFTFSRQRNEFADRYRLFLLSARGHDGSDAIVPANYGIGASDVDDLRAVLEAEQLDRIRLFAHSSGGATAFVFALQSPERVVSQVLIEPTLLSLMPPADYARTAAENEAVAAVADPFARMRAAIDSVGGAGWAAFAESAKLKRLNAMAATAPMVGPHMRGLNQLKVTDADVIGLRPPTLLYYGVDSFPFEAAIAARFRALRPDLEVVAVENSGHNVHRDQSALVNARALAFLG